MNRLSSLIRTARRRGVVGAAALGLGLGVSACEVERAASDVEPAPAEHVAAPASSAPTNVLLVVLDDVGRDEVGVYQGSGASSRTPNIDALAADGVRFTQTWTNPVCSPTRASVLTGRHAFRHRVGEPIAADPDDTELQSSETTIAELLRGAGYSTGLFGKWHLGTREASGCQPATHGGFDLFQGGLQGQLPSYWAWPKTTAAGASACTSSSQSRATAYATIDTATDAAGWIAQQAAAQRPWLAMVAFNAAHTPWHVPPADLHSDRALDGVGAAYCNSTSGDRQCYLAMLEAMDTELGALLESVRAIDGGVTLANTLIVVLGDNGNDGRVAPSGVDPSRAKGTVYQAGVTVPMIVSGARVASPGRAVSAITNSLDLFRTIADVAGVTPSSSVVIDSVSLTPYLSGTSVAPQRSTVLTEVFADGDPAAGDVAIRNARYKLVVLQGGTEELYDLVSDPQELTNLNDGSLTLNEQRNLSSLRATLAAYGR